MNMLPLELVTYNKKGKKLLMIGGELDGSYQHRTFNQETAVRDRCFVSYVSDVYDMFSVLMLLRSTSWLGFK